MKKKISGKDKYSSQLANGYNEEEERKGKREREKIDFKPSRKFLVCRERCVIAWLVRKDGSF